jgi:hypothetical protein
MLQKLIYLIFVFLSLEISNFYVFLFLELFLDKPGMVLWYTYILTFILTLIIKLNIEDLIYDFNFKFHELEDERWWSSILFLKVASRIQDDNLKKKY